MAKYLPHGTTFHFAKFPVYSSITSVNTTDIITITAHGLSIGDAIIFTALTGGAGITLNQLYYIIATNFTANTFMISDKPAGTTINHTSDITAGTAQGLMAVKGLISVGFPDAEKEEAETTDTYSAGSREFIPGLRDFGSVELSCRHDPEDAGQTNLDNNFLALKDVGPCAITLPDGATAGVSVVLYRFTGFVMAGPQGDLPLADSEAAEVSYTVRVAGPVTKVTVA